MFYYAQLDENNICIGISRLSGKVDLPTMILLDSNDVLLLGKRYNNGKWEEVEQPAPEPEPLTETERTILETSLNVEYLICLAELS